MKNLDGYIVIHFFDGMFYPLQQIVKKYKDFFILTSVLSLVMTLISFILGRNLLCYAGGGITWFFCSKGFLVSLISVILFLYATGWYINRWYLICNENMNYREAIAHKQFKKDFSSALFVVFYIILWVVIAAASYALDMRLPSADWKIELLFFVVVSMLIIGAIFLMMNFVLFIRFLQGNRWLCIRNTFLAMFDNMYNIIGWFIFYMILFSFLFRFFIGNLVYDLKNFLLIGGLIGDFCFYFWCFSISAIFVSELDYQAKIIFEDDC